VEETTTALTTSTMSPTCQQQSSRRASALGWVMEPLKVSAGSKVNASNSGTLAAQRYAVGIRAIYDVDPRHRPGISYPLKLFWSLYPQSSSRSWPSTSSPSTWILVLGWGSAPYSQPWPARTSSVQPSPTATR